MGFFVYLAFVRGFTLGLLCFRLMFGGKMKMSSMVMEEKQNKRSSLEVHLALMGYCDLRTYYIFYGSFRLVMSCACERTRKNMGFWC